MASLLSSPWIPWLWHFMMGFVATSCVAIANYWLFHEKRNCVQDFLSLLSVFMWGVFLFATRPALPIALCLVVITLSSFFQTFIERAIDQQRLTFKHHFIRALLTHLCLIHVIWVILGAGGLGQARSWSQGVGIGVFAAFLLTPLSISALRSILLTSKLQPGFDRLFQPQEKPGD